MVRKARVCFDEELAWNLEHEDEGGVAVQTQTAVLLKLHIEEEPADSTTELEDDEPALTPSDKTDSARERRHLAGANWMDDWTQYFPVPKRPPRKKRRAK